MIRFQTILVLIVSLFVAANGACEQEIDELNECIADDCKTCLALDVGGVAWMSCGHVNDQFCDSIEQCSDSCGACMGMHEVWAACYVGSLGHVDCELSCDSDGRLDETTSSASTITMTEYLVGLLLVSLVAM